MADREPIDREWNAIAIDMIGCTLCCLYDHDWGEILPEKSLHAKTIQTKPIWGPSLLRCAVTRRGLEKSIVRNLEP